MECVFLFPMASHTIFYLWRVQVCKLHRTSTCTLLPLAATAVRVHRAHWPVCQTDLRNNPISPISIYDTTMQWSTFTSGDQTGVQFVTTNGGPPNCQPSNKPRFATMQFVCQLDGEPTFTMIASPPLQGCASSPGFAFQYTTPFACSGYTPPPPPPPPPSACSYLLKTPCVIKSYNQYAWADGLSLDFNQGSNACGKILFSDYVIKAQPEDTCSNSTPTGYRLITHMDILAFSKILEMVQRATPQNPIVYFWDVDANSGAIGPTQTTSSEDEL